MTRKSPSSDSDSQKALRFALRKLSERARTCAEIREALASRFSASVTDGVIEKLAATPYLKDESVLQDAEYRQNSKRFLAPERLKESLISRGISPELADQAKNFKAPNVQEWLSTQTSPDASGKQVAKLARQLAAKGYSWEELESEFNLFFGDDWQFRN